MTNEKLDALIERILDALNDGPYRLINRKRLREALPDALKDAGEGWYVVSNAGVATLCADEADARDVAAGAAELWPQKGPHRVGRMLILEDES